MEDPATIVDVSFRLRGSTIPADHGYALFSAISRLLPTVHGDERIGIHPIRGQAIGNRQLALTPTSRLTLRVPLERLAETIKLAGASLDLDGSGLLVGLPTVKALRPAASLHSRLVVIKGFLEAGDFLEAARRQLAQRGIRGEPALVAPRRSTSLEGRSPGSPVVRRTLRIRGREIVGYALNVQVRSPEDSLRLQADGLGGRRRFGCGIFGAVSQEDGRA